MSPTTDGQRKEMMDKRYREIVGTLMYIACSTRPDISYAVSEVARFVPHWDAVIHICQYLKGTINYALCFDGNKTNTDQVVGYSDADWGGEDLKLVIASLSMEWWMCKLEKQITKWY
jgi:hypothetical protein